MFFASDNTGPVHPRVMEALAEANAGHMPSYGSDDLTRQAEDRIREIFEAPEAAVYLVATGTTANALALACLTRPWDTVFCTPEAHVQVDECNAPEFYTGGAKLTLVGEADRMTPAALDAAMTHHGSGDVHIAQSGPVSLTQVTENGRLYALDELRALTEVAKRHANPVHLDGARFANSPFFEGRKNGHKSWRSRIWRDLDDARTGMVPFVFDDGFGFERWVQYALDVPMYFVYRDGEYIDALGQSFRDFLRGELPALPGEKPLMSDWADHLTTLFPEARVKKFIEMRGADGGPWRRLCALPAFWVGLTYDQGALDAAWDLVKDWDAETREALRVAASVGGLAAEAGGVKMHDLAREVLAISESGLVARGRAGSGGLVPDETHFLNALRESVESGKVPADELVEQFEGDWGGDLSRIYAAHSY